LLLRLAPPFCSGIGTVAGVVSLIPLASW
jgi:hypothetical protein